MDDDGAVRWEKYTMSSFVECVQAVVKLVVASLHVPHTAVE